jgi:3'-5' exoribonuclease
MRILPGASTASFLPGSPPDFPLDTISLQTLDGSVAFPAVQILTITELKRAALQGPLTAELHAQIESLGKKDTRDGKPFWELAVTDAESRHVLRAWSDGPAFKVCAGLKKGAFLAIEGEWAHGQKYGLEATTWTCRELTEPERNALLSGPHELRARQALDFEYVREQVAAIGDPRLRGLGELFLEEFGEHFRRTAAARSNHHARRGGLVEHVAQMMRLAIGIAGAYPSLNRDLLVAGVLFHDCGKLWENAMPPDGFTMPFHICGEMLGHITVGIELVNNLWRRLMERPESAAWAGAKPSSDDVKLHLLHLLASHHGQLEFGSPIMPKTPEAWALHHIDNLDAKLEMMRAAYVTAKPLAPKILERVWPLPGNLITPLARFSAPVEPAGMNGKNGHTAEADCNGSAEPDAPCEAEEAAPATPRAHREELPLSS